MQLSTPTSSDPKKTRKNRRRSGLFKTVVSGEAAKARAETTRSTPSQPSPTPSSSSRPVRPKVLFGKKPSEDQNKENVIVPQKQTEQQSTQQSALPSSEENGVVQQTEEPSPQSSLPNKELRMRIEEADSLFGTFAPITSGSSIRVAGANRAESGGIRRKSVMLRSAARTQFSERERDKK